MNTAMGDGLVEFRIELYNDFPPDDPATKKVEIKEDTWDLDGYSVTLWSARKDGVREALQGVSYSDDVSF